MKKKIAIRVDADNKIGIGHLLRIKGFIYRSINEYEKFLVITKSDKKLILKHLSHKKIKIFFLKKNRKEQIYQILLNQNCKLLLSDISNLSDLANKRYFKNYHNFFKRNKIITVSIDDPRQFINSHISFVPYPVDAYQLKKDKKTKLFFGIKYICFNKDIKIKPKKIKKNPNNILISIGSDDKKNYSLKILKSILKLNLPIRIKILMNKKRISKFKDLQKKYKNIYLITNISNMDLLLNWSDIFIGGEGLSKFEAALKGVPHIFINNVENDKKDMQLISQFLKLKTSFFFKIQNFDSIRFNLLFLKLFKNTKLRRKYSKNGLKIFDLKGAERVYKVINTFYKKFYVSND